MSVIDVGTICIKTRGREKGRKCVIVDLIDKNYVLITGPKTLSGIRRQRSNIMHLSPTGERINLKRGSSDDDVIKALKGEEKVNLTKG